MQAKISIPWIRVHSKVKSLKNLKNTISFALFDFPPKWVPFHDPISLSVIKNPTSKSLRDGEGVTPGVSGSTREGDAERSVEGRSKRLRKESRENIAVNPWDKTTNFHCLVKLLPSG